MNNISKIQFSSLLKKTKNMKIRNNFLSEWDTGINTRAHPKREQHVPMRVIAPTRRSQARVARTCESDSPSLRTACMASAIVSGRHDLSGPRSLKRRFCSKDCVWFQDFCQAAWTCAWYVSGTETATLYAQHSQL